MVSQSASAVTTFLFNRIMMRLPGENGVAAITIIIYTQFLLTALYIGFSMGVAPVISYNYGKRDDTRLKKVFSMCMRFLVVVSLLIFPFSFLFCGLNIFASAVFTALSNGKLSAILSFLRTFGLILVLLLILPEVLGVTGVWLAVPMAEFFTVIVALVFLSQNKELRLL